MHFNQTDSVVLVTKDEKDIFFIDLCFLIIFGSKVEKGGGGTGESGADVGGAVFGDVEGQFSGGGAGLVFDRFFDLGGDNSVATDEHGDQ